MKKSTTNTLYRLQIKVGKGLPDWMIWGLYIYNALTKELTFASSKRTGTISPSQQLHPLPRHEPLPAT